MDSRQEFLTEFLSALGAREIRNLCVTPASVSGTVVYDPSDPEEQQDFRWPVPENAAPSPAVVRLAGLIRRARLLHGDRLTPSRQELLARFNAGQDWVCPPDQFTAILEELLQVQVPMLDEGVESDYYFMHE
ncbi:hypothetical protein [Agrilutibacter solisilvae]|uniref:Uncharacterized protein n=1 Tax=Agrilutibacter solisilvae TaxID=2763317 RepID=A0A974Y1W2_9GAMM|nr:hypothetical protein [Lysobacter solisilvae]QSX79723.1 hypothetical protein I8J32_007765 [Lysobacter solisilvae]